MLATCEPYTPRRRVQLVDRRRSAGSRSSFTHLVWCGRMPLWSMSGFVTTTCARARICLARVLRRVAVVGEGADVGAERLDHRAELGELVLRERLRREQVECPRVGVLQDAVEDGQVVAERLARGGGGHDHDVPSGLDELVGLALVAVEPAVAPSGEGLAQARVERLGKADDVGRLRREVTQGGQHRLAAQRLLDLERLQDREQRRVAPGAGGYRPGRRREKLRAQGTGIQGRHA